VCLGTVPLTLPGLKVILLTYLDKVSVWLGTVPLALSGLPPILPILDPANQIKI
jgi:hypothetical protein